jgi:uncharacterized protein
MSSAVAEQIPLWQSLAGGGLIGAGAATLLLLNGRIARISGILGSVLRRVPGDHGWRLAFLAGLLTPAILLGPGDIRFSRAGWLYGIAGLLVGFGTYLGSGCTSGHGVCGIADFSRRSLIATATFIAVAALTVLLMRLGSLA